MKEMKFEEAITSLEDIVKKLENGSLSLDESINAFNEAVKLVKLCTDKLDNAEQQVRVLVEGKDGSVTDMPFDVAKDEN